MPWGNRKHPSDSGAKTSWGWQDCPRCGRKVTKNAMGFKSHLRACLSRSVTVDGKVFPPADKGYIDIHYPRRRSGKASDGR